MAMYKIDQLLDDVVRLRGGLRRGAPADKSDYQKVWDAFNRYLTVVHQKKQTLNVHNFFKIGWKIEEHQGKARLRPHFQLAESFMRVFNVEAKSHPYVADRSLTSAEEFNLSKAAIRYSSNLTKDNIFMGLRAIVHQIGEAAAREQVAIDLEVGRLLCKDRDMQFVFLADIYQQEGLEVPDGAVETTDYKPSSTFAPPTKDALSLNVRGSSQFSGTVIANKFGGWEDIETSPRSPTSAATAEGLPPKSSSSVASSEEGRQIAHVEALGRHIAQMEADAAKVIAEKKLWEGHLDRCNDLEQKHVEWRRAIARDYADQLKIQIEQDDAKRAQCREANRTEDTMHDFPCFKEAADADVRGYLHERRMNLKHDLDQQVESKKRMQQAQKRRDKELELVNMEASHFEIKSIKKDEIEKQAKERFTLAQSWDQDVRLKTVKKAIEDHHRTPGPKAVLHSLVNNLGGSVVDGPPSFASASPRLTTPGAQSDRSSVSSRMSGSARKVPLGAAASLALNKEKLKVHSARQ